MQFPNVYTKDTKSMFSVAGSPMQPVYKMKVDADGVRELRKVGEEDLYAMIQSHKDSCDVNYILQRFMSGDQTALSKIQGVYGDFTDMPTTLAELSQRVVDAENLFYSLDLSVREQFNHSPSEFFASIGSEKFNSIFAAKQDQIVVTSSQKEVATDPVASVVEKEGVNIE